MKPRAIPSAAGVASVLLALAGTTPAFADYERGGAHENGKLTRTDYARVVDVKPLIRTVSVEVPVRECYETPPRVQTQAKRPSLGKTIAGGIIGGVIGAQFGGGSGKDAMTVLGTVIGAASASKETRQREVPAQRYCETRYEIEQRDRVEGFRVTYVYDGETYTTRTKTDPGDEIRVRISMQPLVD